MAIFFVRWKNSRNRYRSLPFIIDKFIHKIMKAIVRRTFIIDLFFHPAQAQFYLAPVSYDYDLNPVSGLMYFKQKRMILPETTTAPRDAKSFEF